MKHVILGIFLFFIIGCVSTNKNEDGQNMMLVESNPVDTLLWISYPIVEENTFIKLQMNSEAAYITMADSIIPSMNDSTIALCVEAAFTGQLLNEFKSTNIAGDYVINGILHKGYECIANTGCLYADRSVYGISSIEHLGEWIEFAQKNNGTIFQQVLLLKDGKKVYKDFPITSTSSNIYRSACIMNNGVFAVIQSQKSIPLNKFIEALLKLGTKDALYLDMGKGWNYGWYRLTMSDNPVTLFDYKSHYQTNWLVIKGKIDNI